MREGTSNTVLTAMVHGDLVSGALVSRPCLWSGRPAAVLHSVWRSHAQAPSGDVQSGSGATLDRERSHGGSAQLPFVLGTDRTKPGERPASSLFARHSALQELRTPRALYRRGCLAVNQFAKPSSLRPGTSVLGIHVGSQRALLSHRVAHVVFSGPRNLAAGFGMLARQPRKWERGNCYVSH